MSEQEKQHQDCTNRFIELANQMKDDKIDPALVSGSLMTASSIYATYVAAGNDGALEKSGIEKVTDLYRRTLEQYQRIKMGQIMNKKLG